MSQSILLPVCHSFFNAARALRLVILPGEHSVCYSGHQNKLAHHSQIVFFFAGSEVRWGLWYVCHSCRPHISISWPLRLHSCCRPSKCCIADQAAVKVQVNTGIEVQKVRSPPGPTKRLERQQHNNRTKVLKQTYYKVKGPLKCH